MLPLILALLASPGHARHPGEVVAPHAVGAPVVFVRTADGGEVVVQHHATPGGPPVVLCHGISSNHHFWDLAPDRSLALYLQGRGFDVWNLDLRGHGFAIRTSEGKKQRGGTLDQYAAYDLPAVFDHVRAETGADEVAYVGHSMGGIVLAAYLATHPDPPLSAVVVVASPLDFRDPDAVTDLLLGQSWVANVSPALPTPSAARFLASFGDHAPWGLDDLLFDPPNIADKDTRKLLLRNVTSPLYRTEARQFGTARHDGEIRPMEPEGAVPFRQRLGGVTVPMLFLAGRADRVANPDRVRAYYEAVGSPTKAFVVASVANGFHGDYGHLDFGAADHAVDDVFPRIAEWLLTAPTTP